MTRLVLLLKPTVSHDKYDKSLDKTACYATCSFSASKAKARILNQRLFLSPWRYLISGAWGWKYCIYVLFELSIGTWNTLFFEFSSPKIFGMYNC